jgi:hypothetical protein
LITKYNLISLSRTRLTWISDWVEFLSKSRTSLCINIYNLTCWVEFGRVEISVVSNKNFGPRDVESHIIYIRDVEFTCQNMRITLGLKLDHRWNIRSFILTFLPWPISQSVKLISDNIWIGLVLWHRLDVYNKKLSIHNKCAWVGMHQWLWKVHNGSILSIELFVGN